MPLPAVGKKSRERREADHELAAERCESSGKPFLTMGDVTPLKRPRTCKRKKKYNCKQQQRNLSSWTGFAPTFSSRTMILKAWVAFLYCRVTVVDSFGKELSVKRGAELLFDASEEGRAWAWAWRRVLMVSLREREKGMSFSERCSQSSLLLMTYNGWPASRLAMPIAKKEKSREVIWEESKGKVLEEENKNSPPAVPAMKSTKGEGSGWWTGIRSEYGKEGKKETLETHLVLALKREEEGRRKRPKSSKVEVDFAIPLFLSSSFFFLS